MSSVWARHWHAQVPAVRLAAFRTLLGVFTVTLFAPKMAHNLARLAHYPLRISYVEGLPVPSEAAVPWITALLVAAGVALTLGVAVRAAAAGLAAFGLWLVLVDVDLFKFNFWLATQLYALLAVAPADRVRLWQLAAGSARERRAPAWPERIVLFQVALPFGYGTVHKIVSTDWGLAGAKVASLAHHKFRPVAFARLDDLGDFVVQLVPGPISVGVIVLEAAIFVLLLRRRPWWLAALAAAGFALSIEVLLSPYMFAWMIASAALLVAPAGCAALRLAVEPGCGRCALRRRAVVALDWLGRVACAPAPARRAGAPCAGLAVEHAGEALRGLRAAVRLGVVAVTPALLAVFATGLFGYRAGSAWASNVDGLIAGALVLGGLVAWDLASRRRRAPAPAPLHEAP